MKKHDSRALDWDVIRDYGRREGDEMKKVTIWGLAAGRGTTTGAAYGAFTWRDYHSVEAAKVAERDWQRIIKVQYEGGATP